MGRSMTKSISMGQTEMRGAHVIAGMVRIIVGQLALDGIVFGGHVHSVPGVAEIKITNDARVVGGMAKVITRDKASVTRATDVPKSIAPVGGLNRAMQVLVGGILVDGTTFDAVRISGFRTRFVGIVSHDSGNE